MPTNIFSLPTEINALLTIGGTDNVAVTSTGNVGIGTTSPSQKLTVSGNIDAQYDANNYSRLGSSSSGGYIQSYSGGTEKIMLRSYGDSFFNGGNVGIGTSSPAAKLDIAGGGAANTEKVIVSGDDAIIRLGGVDTNGPHGLQFGYDSAIGSDGMSMYYRTGPEHIVFENSTGTSGSGLMVIQRSGNVGIGTTSPASVLHIKNSVPEIVLEDSDVANRKGKVLANNGNLGLFADSDNVQSNSIIYFNIDSSEKMRIQADGYVGIGTTSPSAKLNVAGNAIIGDGVSRATNGLTVGYSKSTVYTADSDSGDANRAVTIINNQNNTANTYATLGFRVSPNTSTSMGDFKFVRTAADENSLIWSARHGTSWYDRFTIKSDGNVGIGTTSPAYKLHVIDSTANGRAVQGIQTGTSGTNYGAVFTAEGGGATKNVGLYANAEGATTNYAAILNNGLVGIGTTTPLRKLHVAGNTSDVTVRVDTTGADPSITLTTLGQQDWGIGVDYSDGGKLKFDTSTTVGANTKVAIDGSGNVGIGTTSPAASLHIEKPGDQTSSVKGIVLSSGASGTNKFLPSINWSYGAYGTPDFAKIEAQRGGGTSGRILFSTANSSGTMSEAVRINEDGNVGIGTTSPAQKLDVAGNIVIPQGNFLSIRRSGVDNPILWQGNGTFGSADQLYLRQPNNNNLHLQTNGGNTRLLITGGGNVGIGTTSPGYRLHLNTNTGTLASFDNGDGAIWSTLTNTKSIGLSSGTNYASGNNFTWMKLTGGSSGSMIFSVNTERMRITNTGNVGIGTTSPSDKLDIADGRLRFTNTTSGRNSTIGMDDNYNFYIKNTALGNLYIGNGTTNHINGNLNVDSGVLFVSASSNNVGIGTDAPASNSRLHINDTGTAIALRLQNSTAGSASILRFQALSSTSTEEYADIRFDPQAGAGALIFRNPFNSERMRIADNGNVGIGYTSPSYTLDVNGTIRGTNVSPSDARLKENVETIPNALERVNAIRGVAYNKIGEQKRSIGVVAQELLEVLPEVVHEDNKGMYSVDYGSITGILIEAIKEQQKQIDELKAMIASK